MLERRGDARHADTGDANRDFSEAVASQGTYNMSSVNKARKLLLRTSVIARIHDVPALVELLRCVRK